MTRRILPGAPEPLGVSANQNGVNVAVFSAHASAIEFCIFDPEGQSELERIILPERIGDIWHGQICDVPVGSRYGLRAQGPFNPREGQRFNRSKLLVDPYALCVDRPFKLDHSMFAYRLQDSSADLSYDETDSAPFVPKAIVTAASPATQVRIRRPTWPQTILYELHVGGFSKRNREVPERMRGTFSGLAHPASIEHLTKLGVTSVELMPVAAWVDERHLPPLGLRNYWGYNPAVFMALDPRVAAGGWKEACNAVGALHEAGIEVLIDIVLNHTGEGDELGPTLSLRGLDNASYYRLSPDNPRYYANETGCGNCVALDRPHVVRLAMDCLRSWVALAGIDGFRFDLGTALGRREKGFDPTAPLLAAIAQDPMLRDLKLIVEPWDVGAGGYQIGAFPALWGEWNDKFRDDVRRFWRGDQGFVGNLATRLAGSADLFGAKRRPSRGVNFITAHDGFTLADLVSYERKHNEPNGEHNRDGTDANFSWNHGVEGPSDDPALRDARAQDQRNLLATLLVSRGTPMLSMGMEFGRSQKGNNNAYAQDNETSWLDWDLGDTALLAFTRRLIALRRDHQALHADRFLAGAPVEESGLPDVEWRAADGRLLEASDWRDPGLTTLVVSLASPSSDGQGADRVIVVINRADCSRDINLPEARTGRRWQKLVDTFREVDATSPSLLPDDDDTICAQRRSVLVFSETVELVPSSRKRSVDPVLLDRLAQAAGIAPDWWDVSGSRHVVGEDTKRTLLATMGLRAETSGQIRESLFQLAESRDMRPLPYTLVCNQGDPIEIRLSGRGPGAGPIRLQIAREDGSHESFRLDAKDLGQVSQTAVDGRSSIASLAQLPPQPIGRHRLSCDDRPETICEITVAPSRCHLPEFEQGSRFFGLAAHLYSLRRPGDQGIGDFTTLSQFTKSASAQGAVTVGLNPLHALFPEQRERASPYHPSDRRFLDPFYLDVTALTDLPYSPRIQEQLQSRADEIAALSAGRSVEYTRVWTLKAALLEEYFRAFENALREGRADALAEEFAAFLADQGAALDQFTCFQAIAEQHGGSWTSWPGTLREAASGEVSQFAAAHAERLRFHAFVQWLCDRQLGSAARTSGLALGLYRDMAVGTAPDGSEAWAHAPYLAQGASIGAPPDPFSAEGQVWNLPPLNPLALSTCNYSVFTSPIAANMRHAGALRIDHVMGLARLFFVPDGAKANAGAYVSYPLDELIGQLAFESVRHRCVVVGEDLGTVPEGLRDRLARANLLSYRVLWFEREGARFKSPTTYPSKAVACVSTHDLPTLAGWWRGEDIAERLRLKMITSEQAQKEHAQRALEKRELTAALLESHLIPTKPDFDAPLTTAYACGVHAYLAASPSMLVLAQAEDLIGETVSLNLPGTDLERPNWRRKIVVPIEQLFGEDTARLTLQELRRVRGLKIP